MLKERLFTIWRILLPVFFFLVLIHFLKDITQDVLKIASPLDVLGDVKEDLSLFPRTLQNIYLTISAGSFLAEAFLLFSIPLVLKRRRISRLEKTVLTIMTLLLIYLFVAVALDPKYRSWLLQR